MTIPSVDNTTLNNLSPNLDVGDIADPALRLAAFNYIYAELAVIVAELNSIPTANYQNLSVTAGKLAALSVETAKIAELAVTTAKINDAAVTLAKMAANSVGTTQLADASVTTAKLADASVTVAKLSAEAQINETVNNALITALSAETVTGWFNAVTGYNAVGDGVADNLNELQATIDAAENAGGGTVYLQAGTYKFSGTLTVPNSVSIIGENEAETVLEYTGSGNAFEIGSRVTPPTYGSAVFYCFFRNFMLKGQDTGVGFYCNIRYSSFQNLIITNFAAGSDFEYSWSNKFYEVTYRFCDIGLNIESNFNANYFSGCKFEENDVHVKAGSLNQTTFDGCEFQAAATYGFDFTGTHSLRSLIIKNSYFENEAPIIMCNINSAGGHVTFDCNYVLMRNTADLAMSLADTGGLFCQINNNTFYRSNGGTTESFIRLGSGANVYAENNESREITSLTKIDLFDSFTQTNITTYIQSVIKYPNTKEFSGAVEAKKGFVVGQTATAAKTRGYIRYSPGYDHLVHTPNDTTKDWAILDARSGTTAQRPTGQQAGIIYFDTTLGKPIWYNGSNWVDATGSTV